VSNASTDLTGKVVVVTGSGRGLGYATALAKAGARVVVNDVDEATAAQTAKSITEADGQAVAEPVAIGSTEAADRLVARAVEEFGRLDVLIPFAYIDPFRGRSGLRQARRLVEEHGMKGFKFHPQYPGLPSPTTASPTRSTGRSRNSGPSHCSTPARPVPAPAPAPASRAGRASD
jgi:hypothetical protein